MKIGANGKRTKAKRAGETRVEAGSGNVFADLGLPGPEDALARAQLAQRICHVIAARKLTQVRAATILGVDQPKVSALMRGKLGGFSTDRLFRFLNALRQDVEISIRPTARRMSAASVRVLSTIELR